MNGHSVRALGQTAARHLAVGDVSSTRTVYAVVLALIGIGLVLIFVAIWLIRQTRPDPELLAPLELMADRSWGKQDPAQKRRSLDDVRPAGASPLQREQEVPEIDEEFAQAKPAVASFDDLHAQQEAEQRRAVARDPLLPDGECPDDTGELDADRDELAQRTDD